MKNPELDHIPEEEKINNSHLDISEQNVSNRNLSTNAERDSLANVSFKQLAKKNLNEIYSILNNTSEAFYTPEKMEEIIGLIEKELRYESELKKQIINNFHNRGLLHEKEWLIILNKPALAQGNVLEGLRDLPKLPADVIKKMILSKVRSDVHPAPIYNFPRMSGLLKFAEFNENSFTAEDAIDLVIDAGQGGRISRVGIQFVLIDLAEYITPEDKEIITQRVVDTFVVNAKAETNQKFSNTEYIEYLQSEGLDPVKTITINQHPDEVRSFLIKEGNLSYDQLIKLLECGHFNRGGGEDWSHVPGWVLYGEKLLYGTYESDRIIIEGKSKPGQKEKYDLMEEMYLKERGFELSKEELERLTNEVVEFGMDEYEPVVPVSEPTDQDILFTHISGNSNLKVLLQQEVRTTDSRPQAIYIQRNGEYADWQRRWLKQVNRELHQYEFYLTEEQVENFFYKDYKWDGGYVTTHPILLGDTKELTWDMFNDNMVDNVFLSYERNVGPIPLQVKERLITDSSGAEFN